MVSNRVFLLCLVGTMLVSLFAFNDAFAAQTVNDRIEIDDDDIAADIAAGDLFGYHIENIGDLDGDGIVDLAVVSFADDVPLLEVDIGSILILFMNSDGSVKSTNKINIDDTADGLGGSNAGSQICIDGDGTHTDTFGLEQIEFVGDLDGDGRPTLAIGMAENIHDGATNTGAIYMVELFSTGKVDTCLRIVSTGDGTGNNGFNPTAAVYNVAGSGNDAELGRILIATDVNSDGQNELLVGAVTLNPATTNDMWTLFLTTTGAVDSFVQITAANMGIDAGDTLSDGSVFGGGNKILLGDQNGGDGGGSIHIVTLTSDGAFSSVTEIEGSSIAGIANDERFGSGVAFLGDMDADGIDDILVGNHAGDDTTNLSGEAHILFLNSDDTLKESQKISNESEFARNGIAPFVASDLFGQGMELWIDSGGNAVIAISAHQDDTGGGNSGALHLFYITRTAIDIDSSKSGGGCSDCIPPTLGINSRGEIMVDGGFNYNGNIVDVKYYHTDFPLITAEVGKFNSIQVKIYENGGISNLKNIQFGLGLKEVGTPLSEAEVIILVDLHHNGTAIAENIIVDKQNLIENDFVYSSIYKTKCKESSNNEDCVMVNLAYSYREAPMYNVLLVNAMDDKRNNWNHYFNDGIQVIGESLNEPLTEKIFFKKTNQDNGEWLTFTRIDKIKNMWRDSNDIEYLFINNKFDRITPHEEWSCDDKPLNQINVPTRNNCNFRSLTNIWGQ